MRTKGQRTKELFWAKVDKSGECWEWRAAADKKGYGRVQTYKDGRSVVVLAHRLSYEWANGPIPDGMFVCHRCDNPRCVRPDHLFVGTAKDNSRDCKSKGRMVVRMDVLKPFVNGYDPRRKSKRGEDAKYARLTVDKIHLIRKLRNDGLLLKEIAEQIGVGRSTIQDVLKNRTWTHV